MKFLRLLLSIFVYTDITLSERDPLKLDYDPLNGQHVLIRSTNWTEIDKIEYRLISNTSSRSWSDLYQKPINSPTSIPQFSYEWIKPDGVCGQYDIRTTFVDNSTLEQTLYEPPLEFLSSPNVRLAALTYDRQSEMITASLIYLPDLKYWPSNSLTFDYVEPVLKPLACQKIYDRYPVPPLMADRVGQVLKFDPQYAYSNCSFMYGLNVSFKIIQNKEEKCQRNFTSSDADSLILNLSCSTVKNLRCPRATVINGAECAADCSPLEVRTVHLSTDSRKSFRDSDEDYLLITWSYPNPVEKSVISYQARYQSANLSDWNTVLGEGESTKVDFERNSLEIHPNSNIAESTNYTFQLCALTTPNCTLSTIDWNKVDKYKVEYFHRKSSSVVKNQPLSAKTHGRSVRYLCDKILIGVLFAMTILMHD